MTKKHILIVGGTGFIGYHLSKRCLKNRWFVTSISTKQPLKSRFLRGVQYIIVNISKKKDLVKKLNKKYDYIVNLGGHVDHSRKKKTYMSHYVGCKNIVEALDLNYPKVFIQMGSSAEYGNNKSPLKENSKCNPTNVYGKSKLLSTKYLLNINKKKNFPIVILRLFQAYGPKQSINRIIPIAINGCINNEKFKCSSGVQFRDFVHINDLIDAIFLAFKNKTALGNIFNIGSGQPKKIKDVILFIKNYLNKGFPQFGKIKMRRDEVIKNYADTRKVKKLLKWSPKISFKEGLISTINTYIYDQKKRY